MDADALWLYDHDYGTATLQVPELPQLAKRRSKSEKKCCSTRSRSFLLFKRHHLVRVGRRRTGRSACGLDAL